VFISRYIRQLQMALDLVNALIVVVADLGNKTPNKEVGADSLSKHQTKDSTHSQIETRLANSSSPLSPRLERSLQRLNVSVDGFEQIYAKHKSKEKETDRLSDSLSKVLSDISLTDGLFDSAAALENRINETMIEREERNGEPNRRQSLSRYVVSMFPLVKFLVDFGGMASQVSFPDDLDSSSGCGLRSR
jgi:hypothetical protein